MRAGNCSPFPQSLARIAAWILFLGLRGNAVALVSAGSSSPESSATIHDGYISIEYVSRAAGGGSAAAPVPVPEPSAAALVALTTVAFFGRRRR